MNTHNKYVTFESTMGNMVIELDFEKAPITSENFRAYVESGHFDGTLFHRVIPGFVIQGGGLDLQMKEKKTRDPITNESHNGLSNLKGTLSMARTSNPHSASCQFFINLGDNLFLDAKNEQWGYAVFGKVVKGFEVVEQIAKVETGDKGYHSDVPLEPIVITKAFMHETISEELDSTFA
jgi:peptidyl-prolyl cis-trans isomerase B (cyclophilin B)